MGPPGELRPPRLSAGFAVETERGTTLREARQVVVASGGFTGPLVPGFARRLDEHTVQLHSSDYRNLAGIPEGEVLVVGAGNTGVQIAQELAEAGAAGVPVALTLGKAIPNRLLGRSLFWWFELLGAMDAGPTRGRPPAEGTTTTRRGHRT